MFCDCAALACRASARLAAWNTGASAMDATVEDQAVVIFSAMALKAEDAVDVVDGVAGWLSAVDVES